MGPPYFLAGGEGFEPPLAESESAVLPLDDPPNPPAFSTRYTLVGADLSLVRNQEVSYHRIFNVSSTA